MTQKIEHTQGPWKLTEIMGHSHVRNLSGETVVGFTTEGPNCRKSQEARLIAVAPELLEALKEAEAFIKKHSGGGETDFRARLNEAIAKATGEIYGS